MQGGFGDDQGADCQDEEDFYLPAGHYSPGPDPGSTHRNI